MRKPVIWIVGLMSSLLLLCAVSEIHARWTAESRGTIVATPPAATLGFDLRTFKGPIVAGSHLFGTESFHWEAPAADGSLNRLNLLMSDERFCWTTVRMGEVKDRGCVVAGKSVQ
jgi:hypothetical protein